MTINYRVSDLENRETSKNLKYSKKVKNQIVAPRMVPPPNNEIENSFIVGKRNPIRHYRKQIIGTNTANILINPNFDVPGRSIIRSTEDCKKCDNNDVLFFSEEIYPNNEPTKCVSNCNGYQSNNPNIWKYTCCSKENNVIKSSNTNLSKKYSTSNRDYLKNRGKTFSSNLYSDITKNSRDCSNCHINNIVNNNNSNVAKTGNINNAIGGTSMSAYIYRRSFRDIAENSISNNNNLCCPEAPGKLLYKNNNNICKVNDYPNLSRRAILCRRR
tara:strand:- start:1987 stop:2802 length:816 start_codon:yes stop_codon:yes gene_type:complete